MPTINLYPVNLTKAICTNINILSLFKEAKEMFFPKKYLIWFNLDYNYENATALVITILVNNHENQEKNAPAEAWEKRSLIN